MRKLRCVSISALVLVTGLMVAGCSRDEPVSPGDAVNPLLSASAPPAPTTLVTVAWNGEDLEFWPYTGDDFSGSSVDPINLVFMGDADPVRIRAALMALDGDRTAYGFPPIPPFNGTWSDAMGGVQTTYAADGEGWIGSVVQVQVGGYGPVRFHLRLFETRAPFGEGTWTLGAAHFEILIPGTTDHQVLSWELAEKIVVADFARAGLLGAELDSTGVITTAPAYRDIPAQIYNGVPDLLKVACGLPPGPAGGPVPIPNDGEATMLLLAGLGPAPADVRTEEFTIPFSQLIPRPLCSGGALDWIFVDGPVSLRHYVSVNADGAYSYQAEIRGNLTATPMDVLQDPPVPAGPSFNATASDVQSGFITGDLSNVMMQSRRIIHEGRAEKAFIRLQVHEHGQKDYRLRVSCIE